MVESPLVSSFQCGQLAISLADTLGRLTLIVTRCFKNWRALAAQGVFAAGGKWMLHFHGSSCIQLILTPRIADP